MKETQTGWETQPLHYITEFECQSSLGAISESRVNSVIIRNRSSLLHLEISHSFKSLRNILPVLVSHLRSVLSLLPLKTYGQTTITAIRIRVRVFNHYYPYDAESNAECTSSNTTPVNR